MPFLRSCGSEGITGIWSAGSAPWEVRAAGTCDPSIATQIRVGCSHGISDVRATPCLYGVSARTAVHPGHRYRGNDTPGRRRSDGYPADDDLPVGAGIPCDY